MTTATQTRTASITLTDVRHVLWRMTSDLRVLRAEHGMLTEAFEASIANDLTAFIYRDFINSVEFAFVAPTTNTAKFRVAYSLIRTWSGESDDDSGGLRYCDLTGTTFSVFVTYTATWTSLAEAEKQAFCETLKCSWGPATRAPHGTGRWTTDRSYGSGSLGAARSVFRPY